MAPKKKGTKAAAASSDKKDEDAKVEEEKKVADADIVMKDDAEKPTEEKAKDAKPSDEKLKDQQPEDEKPKDEKPKDEKPKDDKPKDEKPKDEKPKDENPKDEKSKEEAKEEPEKPNEPDKQKELEEDAPQEKRPKVVASSVGINMADTTLNVLPTAHGRLLMGLSEGGFQYLLAGARANVGVKSGRYMFEVKIIETLNPAEPQGAQGRIPQPKQLVRVGFSLTGSSLFLADTLDAVFFDSEGYFVHEKKRTKVGQKISRDQVIAVVLNLDKESPNDNTVSLFRDGVRLCEPQKLPDSMVGKGPLFPSICYRNVTLQVNFGNDAMAALPFKCNMLAEAAQTDVQVTKTTEAKQSEVLFPVGLPDHGVFDWVDAFVEQHPEYTELSDRKILEWASKSEVYRKDGYGHRSSNDKPDMKFGIPLLDDTSVRQALAAVSPMLNRSYIVAELQENMVSSSRKDALLRFNAPNFKKVAAVIVGEPSSDHKDRVQALILSDKQGKLDAERKKRTKEEERKRLLEERRKMAEKARKQKEAAQKKKDGKEDEKEDEEIETKENEPEAARMEDDTPAELTEEEKAQWHRKLDTPDLSSKAFAKTFANVSLPTKEEGFDVITYPWQNEAVCAKILKEWVLEKKLTQRVEDLQPSSWFKEAWSKWQKVLQEWRKKQNDFKDPVKRKILVQKKKDEAKKKEETKDDENDDSEAKDAKEEDKAEPMEINVEDIDVFSVEDVCDLGNCEPLFANFVYEDWSLLSARFELHLLLHAFKKDLNDPDRPSFGEDHLAFYFQTYFKKAFTLKNFGTETFADFADLVKDTVEIGKENGLLEAQLNEDTAHSEFVKFTEEHRRERQRRIDAGDETAKLKFARPAPPPPRQLQQGGASSPGTVPRRAPAQQQQQQQQHQQQHQQQNQQQQQQQRYSGGSGGRPGGQYSSAQAPHSSGQKRPYTTAPSYHSSKQPRMSYSGAYGNGGYYRR